MEVIMQTPPNPVATVSILRMRRRHLVECVQSIQPPFSRREKWILMISTLFGCPVGCPMCDAGGNYAGILSVEEMATQIDHLVRGIFPDGRVRVSRFKIQFARMGEPALNHHVLELLEQLPDRVRCTGALIPSLSTVAPEGREGFFRRLVQIKNRLYSDGNFQLQFSLHSTDSAQRDRMIPVKKWDFDQIARYGKEFYRPGDRKITLNFAWGRGQVLDPEVIAAYFDPRCFLIKITPVNPTVRARKNRVENLIESRNQAERLGPIRDLKRAGYRVIISIGEREENRIGSNCGQYIRQFLRSGSAPEGAYTYQKVE